MSDNSDATAKPVPRAYSWAMLVLSLAAAVIGVIFIANPDGWWTYATAAVAIGWAALLIYFGVRGLSRSSSKRVSTSSR